MEYYLTVSSVVEVPIVAIHFAITSLNVLYFFYDHDVNFHH